MQDNDFQEQEIKTFFRRDRLAALLGIELTDVGPGRATARLTLAGKHLNGVDIAHGGTLFTLADLAFAAASNSHGTVAVGINATISYLRPSRAGETLTARAEEVARSHRLATYEVRISNEQGDLVALFQGTVYRKQERLADIAG